MGTCPRCGARMVELVYSTVCADACERGPDVSPSGPREVREGEHRRWVRLHYAERPPSSCVGWDIISSDPRSEKTRENADKCFEALPDPDLSIKIEGSLVLINSIPLFPADMWSHDDIGEGWYLEDV